MHNQANDQVSGSGIQSPRPDVAVNEVLISGREMLRQKRRALVLGDAGSVWLQDRDIRYDVRDLKRNGVVAGLGMMGGIDLFVLVRHGNMQTIYRCSLSERGSATAIQTRTGDLRKIAVAHGGILLALDTTGNLWSYRLDSDCKEWVFERGEVEDVGASGSPIIWLVTTSPRYGGRVVVTRDVVTGREFTLPSPASAIKVAVGPDGLGWSINAFGDVWRLHPKGAGHFDECQVDTACTKCRAGLSEFRALDVAVDSERRLFVLAEHKGDLRRRVLECEPGVVAPVRASEPGSALYIAAG